MIEQKLNKILSKYAQSKSFDVSFQNNPAFGDLSTNLALQFDNPREAAREIIQSLKNDQEVSKLIDKIEVAGPGFINFWIKEDYLYKLTSDTLDHKDIFRDSEKKKEKINLEYGQPNTHKLPHIGHLFSYIYGESLAKILEANGNEVFRVNYQGDVGLHVAKCLWAFQKQKPDIPKTLENKVMLLQKLYQQGSKMYDENEEVKQEIQNINKLIYEKDPSIVSLWKETRQWSVDYYKQFETKIGISQNKHYFESEVYRKGTDIVNENTGKVFLKSQEAVIFPGSKYKLHDRVFITKHGTPTYEAKDMALQVLKESDWFSDKIIITTANEQNQYFQVVFKALETLDTKYKNKLKHIGFGMINLKAGKMSSRTGEFITATELVNLTIEEVEKIIAKREDLTEEEKKEVAQGVGIAAIKYSFLKSNALDNIKFDIKESISLEGNSGPYIQYTYARILSVVRKADDIKNFDNSCADTLYKEEREIMVHLSQKHEVILAAGKNYSPHVIAIFLYQLAQKYNHFYNTHKIIGSQKEEFRLELSKATAETIKQFLSLLGIGILKKM